MPGLEKMNRILIGDNPFIGVDHLSQDRARSTMSRLDTGKIVRVLVTALSNGADGFVFSTHPAHIQVFHLLEREQPDLAFNIYPLLPYAQAYVRAATEQGTVGMARGLLEDLSWGSRARAIVGAGVSAITMNPHKMLRAFVDLEMGKFLGAAPRRATLKAIFLHEIIVDLALALGLTEAFTTFISHVTHRYNVKAGLVTRNFQRLVEFLENAEVSLENIVIMTPFNRIGFQMNPSREASEKTLQERPQLDVIAMSILSAGLLRLEEAVEYIKSLPNLKSVVVGVSKEEHARDTFRQLRGMKTAVQQEAIAH